MVTSTPTKERPMRKRSIRLEPGLVPAHRPRLAVVETNQPDLFSDPDLPVVPVADVPDLDFERCRRRFTQGA